MKKKKTKEALPEEQYATDTEGSTPVEEEEAHEGTDDREEAYVEIETAANNLVEMTGTAGWEGFYNHMLDIRGLAHRSLVTDEKTADFHRHQEQIKIINSLIVDLKAPIVKLNAFKSRFPLLASEHQLDVVFNEKSGVATVTIPDSEQLEL